MQKLALILFFVTLCLSQTQFPGTYRDFKFPSSTYRHEDFNIQSCGRVSGLLLDTLHTDGKPLRNPDPSKSGCIIDFTSWYHDSEYTITVILNHPFTLSGGIFTYQSGTSDPGGEPRLLDGLGWGNEGQAHNSLFTLHLHSRFTYLGTEPTLNYLGDDDFWVFVNKRIALDQGGRSSCAGNSVSLTAQASSLRLTANTQYDFDFFIAERQHSGYCVKIQMPGNAVPDAPCTQDTDGDTIPDCRDNCPTVNNTDQRDCNRNGVGDACDTVAGSLEYPYTFFVHQNYDGTKDLNDPTALFGQTSAFENIPNVGNSLTKSINDNLPANALAEYRLHLSMIFQTTATENCQVEYFITGDNVGQSPVYTAVVVNNNGSTAHFEAVRVYDTVARFFNFLNAPKNGDGQSRTPNAGKNDLTVRLVTPGCNGKLKLGHVYTGQRYSKTNNQGDNGYYSVCVPPNSCKYGTSRFQGHCACWSGAYGKQCIMEGAVEGNNMDPDTAGGYSRIPDAWSNTVPQITDPKVYFELDFGNMAGKEFIRNFTRHPTCADNGWGKVFDLNTTSPPQLDSAAFSGQSLVMKVSQPMVDGRADGAVFLNADDDSVKGAGKSNCFYPVSPFIFKEVDRCRDVWRFSIPWIYAKDCFWQVINEDSYQVYRGKVIVHNMEWVGTEQWRIIRSVLRVKIRFQRYVSVSISTTATGKNIDQFAITKQIVGLELDQPSLVEIGTLCPWPFELYDFTFSKYPTNKIASYQLAFDGCTSEYQKPCRQYYRTTLNLFPDACTLDGDYELTFKVNCDEANTNNCSLGSDPSDYVTKVNYRLQSENFCATISVDVGIIGRITSHENQTFVGAKVNFIVGRRAYYLVKVQNDLNEPKDSSGKPIIDAYDPNDPRTIIKFSKVELVKVELKTQNGTIARIWANKATLNAYGTACQNHLTDGTNTLPGNAIGFSFILTREVINPPKNGKASLTVTAEVQVTYPNAKKRADVEDPSAYSVNTDVDDDVTPTDTTVNPSNTTTTGNPSTTTTTTGNPSTTTPSTTTSVEPSKDSVLGLFASLILLIVALI